MNKNDLHHICTVLWGAQWQSPLARKLSVNDRTIRRWARGDSGIPAGAAKEIYRIIAERQAAMVIDTLDGLPKPLPPLDLWIKQPGNVSSIHHRPWSRDADKEILLRVAEILAEKGISARVTERPGQASLPSTA